VNESDQESRRTSQIWQSQHVQPPRMSPQHIKRLVRRVSVADRIERYSVYGGTLAIGAILALVLLGRPLAPQPLWLLAQAGVALSFSGVCYIAIQARRRRGILRGQPQENVLESLTVYRTELRRRRDYYIDAWRWSVWPILPGAAVLLMGGMVLDPRPGKPMLYGVGLLLYVLLMLLCVWNYRREAGKYQRELDLLGSPE
jgi:hypothetical protein